jgi:hypothetical protein
MGLGKRDKGGKDLKDHGHSLDLKELRDEMDGTRDDTQREIGSKIG